MISEVMYNPAGANSDNEWIELLNGTTSTLDLSNHRIGYGETARSINTLETAVKPNAPLEPNQTGLALLGLALLYIAGSPKRR